MVDLNSILRAMLSAVGLVYSIPWVAPFVLLPILLLAAAYLVLRAQGRTKPFIYAARARVVALRAALGDDPDPVAERAAFSRNYPDVESALNATGPGSEGLVPAWREFHETLIDETSSPIRNTNRPSAYFQRAAPRQTDLVFWSNVFVGVGLILTFFGLVVALNTAAQGMQGDVAHSKEALTQLLVVAGAKFFTSIAGLLASLMLRFAEHRLSRATYAQTEEICALLERGMLYIPPQRLASEQLDVLREQRDELKTFNSDLALQIGERVGAQFQQVMAPVNASLATLNDSMNMMSEGMGQSAAKAIAEASGGELRALGQTLGALGERLDTLSATVGSSGDEAARQIRAAGEDFARAAADIRAAFQTLVERVDGLGAKLADQGDAAAKVQEQALSRLQEGILETLNRSNEALVEAVTALRSAGGEAAEAMQRELGTALAAGVAESQRTFRAVIEESGEGLKATSVGLSQAGAGMRTAFEGLTKRVDDLGEKLTLNNEAAAAAQSDTLQRMLHALETAEAQSKRSMTEAVKALQDAGSEATITLQREVGAALTSGVAESLRAFRSAMEEAGEGLRATSAGLARAVGEAAERVEQAGAGFQRSGEGAARTAEAMEGVAGQARAVGNALQDSAKGFTAAAAPVALAVQSVNEAAGRITRALESGGASQEEALRRITMLADGIRETQSAAERAWQDYRVRFEGVDEALESVTVKLGQTLGDSFVEFRRFAVETDKSLGDAVSKLAVTLASIEEYAEALGDYVELTAAPSLEAAE